MKRILLVSISLAVMALIFSNFADSSQSSYVFTAVNEGPKLPSTPFNYKDIEIPDHISNPSADDTLGYGSTGINHARVLDIEDDVATLGRVLFYDVKLSALEDISCGSCHDQKLSFADSKSFSEGVISPTKRNSMHLNDLFWSNKEHFLWDMKETDLHEMIRLPLKDENEIGANLTDIIEKLSETNYYPELFQNAYNTSIITEDKIINALVHFISSMVTFESKFDKEASNDFEGFTDTEKLGLNLFSENCTSCHSQGGHDPHGMFPNGFDFNGESPLFFFPDIFNNGLPEDPDDIGAGVLDPFFNHLFKIPTLRNIELTAPYMHDGRFNSLDEVIEHYSSEVIENKWTENGFIPAGGFQFTEEEKGALKSFLMTLTDHNLTTHEMWSDPFKIGTSTNEPVENLVVRPNPMADQSLIEFDSNGNTPTTIHIMNISGQTIKLENTLSNQYTLNKGDFESGTYIIEIIQADKKSVQKLIVR